MSTRILRIAAIDPGVTTGIAFYVLHPDKVSYDFKTLEMGPDEHHMKLFSWLETERPDIVVTERFEYRIVKSKGTEMPGVRLESREYIGVCKLYCQVWSQVSQREYVPQTSGSAKNLFTDTKLKTLGLYQAPSGRQHMNDAVRHLMYYITVTLNRKDFLAPLKPM